MLTQPDRPAGRRLRPAASAGKQLARSRGVELFQPETLRDGAGQGGMGAGRPEALIVGGEGVMLGEGGGGGTSPSGRRGARRLRRRASAPPAPRP